MIVLPWPHKALWPNGRAHWATKAREAAKHKAWAHIAALSAKMTAPDGRVPILLTFHPLPKGPAPDKDNAQASAKAYLDGIAKAMGVDDRLFDPRTVIGERGGKVTISIEGQDEAS